MTISLLYFIIASIVAISVAALLYVYPRKKDKKLPILLFFLRFLSVVAILMLLINPKWERQELSVHKPKLVVAADNSASIGFVSGKETLENSLEQIRQSEELLEKFEVSYFSFGSQTRVLDSLTFDDSQSDPSELLRQIESLNKETNSPVILLTDGNQTNGASYEYFRSNNPIYPVVVGDTTQYVDLAITQINVNQYAFLDNKFPVEIFTLYKGDQEAGAQLNIFENKTKIFSKKLQFSIKNRSQRIETMLPAKTIGQHYYHTQISPMASGLKDEKNIHNNRKDFSVEVVNQQTNILILSSFSHPDLGALKKSIESNKQRKVTIEIGSPKTNAFSDYHLLVLYQPTATMATTFKSVLSEKINTLIITGTKTDWNFLNKAQQGFNKNATNLSEDYLATYNTDFAEFVTKDIGFAQLPPLQDAFGALTMKVAHNTLLSQKIGNTDTEKPLLATYVDQEQRHAVLFGEGFWRWRMLHKLDNQSFTDFDDFFGALIQYTAATVKAQQLHLDYDRICFSNRPILIKASYVDKNHQVDTNASLWVYITDIETNKTEKTPLYVQDNHYQVSLPNLKPKSYRFQVIVNENEIRKSGSFKVLDYNVEQQFNSANQEDLRKLAENSGGTIVQPDQLESLIQNLVKNETYKSIQKAKKISKPLIDWHWLLAIIILSLSTEWFIRKYKGLI